MPTFQFPVEAGQVLQFARAIGEIQPFDHVSYTDLIGRTPPATFLIAADHFDPGCPRRPAPGEAYPGSGTHFTSAGAERRRGFHAAQTFEFTRPPKLGELLTVETAVGSTWSKHGQTGELHFEERVATYRDAEGVGVATATWLKVMVDGRTGDELPPVAPTAPHPADEPVPSTPALPVVPGTSWRTVVVHDLTLTQLVMYAGASGDFIPMHHDRTIATAAGYGDVFAHGMFTMGASATAVAGVLPTHAIRRYHARFGAIVPLGATLTTTVAAKAPTNESHDIGLDLTTRDQYGVTVMTGTIHAVFDR